MLQVASLLALKLLMRILARFRGHTLKATSPILGRIATRSWLNPRPAKLRPGVTSGGNTMSGKRIALKIGTSLAPALLTSMLLAQTPGGGGGGQQPSMPSQQQPPSATMGSPGAGSTAPTTQNFGDQAFVTKALEGGMAEVELGKLAADKSQSQDVKQFAQKMVNDHSQMGDKWFEPLAKELGVSEPKGPSKKDKKLIEKLQGLSGQEFDTQYIQAMLKDHKEDLKDFQNEAQAAQDPNVKQIAEQGTKVITQHLQMIEQIAQNHNVSIDGKSKEVSSNQ
jgi:putative membrane protein